MWSVSVLQQAANKLLSSLISGTGSRDQRTCRHKLQTQAVTRARAARPGTAAEQLTSGRAANTKILLTQTWPRSEPDLAYMGHIKVPTKSLKV